MKPLTHLPEDILTHVIFFLPPPDIVSLRQVSKTLRSLTHEFLVWIRAYQNAAIPRPPGPYARSGDKEALEFLERTLVQSAKAEPWSTRSFIPSARHTVTRIGNGYHRHVSWGRWFITTSGRSIVYHDVHSDNPEIHTLFNLDKPDAHFRRFLCADTVTLLGHPVTYALITGDHVAFPLTLLKIVCHHSSLSLESTTPLSLSLPRVDLIYAITATPRYICMTGYNCGFALFDVTTEKMYYLPPFSSSMPAIELERLMRGDLDWLSVRCLLTNTHAIVIFNDHNAGHNDFLVQAFPLPSEANTTQAAANDMLQMTHEGICEIAETPGWILRDNVVTDMVGSTTTVVQFMDYHVDGNETTFRAIDLTLSSRSSPGPGSLELTTINALFSLVGRPLFAEITSSQDGFGRGIYYFGDNGEPCIRTFSVDASGPICQVVLGPRASVVGLGRPGQIMMGFYAGTGTLCYLGGEQIKVFGFE